jgi:arylsulfatase A-like enzyme
MATERTFDRRKFLARAGAAAAGVAAAPFLNLEDLMGAEAPRPNVLIMLADDTGWNDVGYNGSEIRTPHIDRLASEGVRLNQYYVYPTCSPTRVALLSGRPPSRWGILGPIAGKSTLALPPETETLPRILSRVGYETAITGKWHLGLQREFGPWEYGFDHTHGSLHGQVDQYTHRYKYGDVTWHREGTFTEEEGHATDLIEKEAIEFLRSKRDKDRPFFLYVSFTVPHYPLQEPERWTAPYNDAIENESRRLFAASMTHMDDAVGNILATLETEGLSENTLVIFSSDNGGQEQWQGGADQYDGRHGPNDVLGDNGALRGWKGDLYEGGIRVPAVVRWPGHLSPGVFDQPMMIQDLLPTIAGLAGAQSPSSVEGKDVWAAWTEGEPLERSDRLEATHLAFTLSGAFM